MGGPIVRMQFQMFLTTFGLRYICEIIYFSGMEQRMVVALKRRSCPLEVSHLLLLRYDDDGMRGGKMAE